ncbi:MAG: hypothetical protein HYZ34_15660 [Ignavibacteriae bacterium]|nr:hypothetical protein [Ignavibacteriota bacterium]
MGKVKEQAVAYSTRKKVAVSEKLPPPKQAVLQFVHRLKDDVGYEDIMEGVYVLEQIYNAEKQLDEGKFYTHEEVKKRLSQWLK